MNFRRLCSISILATVLLIGQSLASDDYYTGFTNPYAHGGYYDDGYSSDFRNVQGMLPIYQATPNEFTHPHAEVPNYDTTNFGTNLIPHHLDSFQNTNSNPNTSPNTNTNTKTNQMPVQSSVSGVQCSNNNQNDSNRNVENVQPMYAPIPNFNQIILPHFQTIIVHNQQPNFTSNQNQNAQHFNVNLNTERSNSNLDAPNAHSTYSPIPNVNPNITPDVRPNTVNNFQRNFIPEQNQNSQHFSTNNQSIPNRKGVNLSTDSSNSSQALPKTQTNFPDLFSNRNSHRVPFPPAFRNPINSSSQQNNFGNSNSLSSRPPEVHNTYAPAHCTSRANQTSNKRYHPYDNSNKSRVALPSLSGSRSNLYPLFVSLPDIGSISGLNQDHPNLNKRGIPNVLNMPDNHRMGNQVNAQNYGSGNINSKRDDATPKCDVLGCNFRKTHNTAIEKHYFLEHGGFYVKCLQPHTEAQLKGKQYVSKKNCRKFLDSQDKRMHLSELESHDERWHKQMKCSRRKSGQTFKFGCTGCHSTTSRYNSKGLNNFGSHPHKRHSILYHIFTMHHDEYFDNDDNVIVDNAVQSRLKSKLSLELI
eukprot:768335_1